MWNFIDTRHLALGNNSTVTGFLGAFTLRTSWLQLAPKLT
jgi:hypothetical protein